MASFLRSQGQYLKAVLVGEFFGVTLVSYSYTNACFICPETKQGQSIRNTQVNSYVLLRGKGAGGAVRHWW